MKYLLALIWIFFQSPVFAQSTGIELYAYEQKVIPGIAPAHDQAGENNINTANEDETHIEFLIYLSAPAGKTIYPLSIWIKGKKYGLNAKEASTPVKRRTTKGTEITLVPATKQNVLRLFTSEAVTSKGPGYTALSKQNEVVLSYKMQGHYYYLTKKKLISLETAHLQ